MIQFSSKGPMKYTGLFSESVRNTPVCLSDKYGKKGALQDMEKYSGSRTTSHHALANDYREPTRAMFARGGDRERDDMVTVQRHFNNKDREQRRSSLFDVRRHPENIHGTDFRTPYVPTTAPTFPLTDIDNRPGVYRSSATNSSREKYSRNFQSNYAKDYVVKPSTAYEPKMRSAHQSKTAPIYADRFDVLKGRSSFNYEGSASTYENMKTRQPYCYTKQNYEPCLQPANREQLKGVYNYKHTSTETIANRQPGRLHSDYHSEPMQDPTSGRDLLRNLDKVQEKIRSLLHQKN